MKIDAERFHRIIHAVVPGTATLSADDAGRPDQRPRRGVDLDEDNDELALLDALSREICASAGIARDQVPRVSPLPLDDEEHRAWITRLANRLSSQSARELACVAAHLLAVSDLEIAPAALPRRARHRPY